jgi:phenylalanyl-tRNA synthetase beta subunit
LFSWIDIIEGGSIGSKITNYIDSPGEKAWMLHVNLDLFAMAAFSIPDRRMLWSKSTALHKKFYAESYESSFKKKSPVSVNKYPEYASNIMHLRDFYIETNKPISHIDVYSLIRDVAGDYVEQVEHTSTFNNIMTTKNYQHYRLHMRNITSPNIDNEGIAQILSALRANAKTKLGAVVQ